MEDEKHGAEPMDTISPDNVPIDSGTPSSIFFTPDPETLPSCGAKSLKPEVYPFWGWLDAVVFFCALIFILFGVLFVATVSGITTAMGMAPGLIIAQGIGMGLSILVLSRLLRARYGRSLRESLHLSSPQRIGYFAGLGLGTAFVVAVLGAILKLSELDMPMKQFIRTDLDLLVVGIGAVTFAPIFEEIIFRGFLQPLFCKAIGVAAGITATAALFALPHGSQYGWHWQHLLVITSAGAIFGYIRWRYASTTASTLAHSAYNAFLVAVLFGQRAMGEMP